MPQELRKMNTLHRSQYIGKNSKVQEFNKIETTIINNTNYQ